MSEAIETIQLGPNHRIVVFVDEDAQCPRGDWPMITGFLKIGERGDSRLSEVPAVHEPSIPIMDAVERAGGIGFNQLGMRTEHWKKSGKNWPDEEEFVIRWARIFHGMHLEYDHQHGGYWFCKMEGVEGFNSNSLLRHGTTKHLAKQAEVIEQEQAVYQQWADSEVYRVEHEKLTVWVKLPDDSVTPQDGDETTREEWEHVEGLSGCYLNDDYAALAVAKEHFNLEGAEL